MDRTERSNYLFDFAYMNAMSDATRRTNVEAGFKEKFLDIKKSNSKNAKDYIRNYIDDTLNGNTSNFDQVALNVKNSLCSIDNIDTHFDFGNAQKLINMTAKYLFIMLYNSDNNNLRNGFSRFHCPMDRIMIGTVTKMYRNHLKSIDNNEEKDELRKNLSFYIDANDNPCISSKGTQIERWSLVNWTDLNTDTKYIYDKYQNMVNILSEKEKIMPLEFDLKYWNQ